MAFLCWTKMTCRIGVGVDPCVCLSFNLQQQNSQHLLVGGPRGLIVLAGALNHNVAWSYGFCPCNVLPLLVSAIACPCPQGD